MHVVFSTVLVDHNCLVGYTLWDSFMFDIQSPYAIIVSFAIPASIMVLCYFQMFLVLNTSRQMFNSKISFSERSAHKLRLAQINIFQTFLVIVIVYIVAWSVSQSAMILYLIGYYDQMGLHANIGSIMITFNSCINPFVYAVKYEDFKTRLNTILRI